MAAVILWRRLDTPGHESAMLARSDHGWTLSGTAAFRHEREPCGLGYSIACDRDWQTRSVRVSGHIGSRQCDYRIESCESNWAVNGIAQPQAAGCVDIDLGFSPSTNLLPIRRLALKQGESACIQAAWLRFPEMTLVASEQIYTRVGSTRYRYESPGSRFQSSLTVNPDGFVTDYPGHWTAKAAE